MSILLATFGAIGGSGDQVSLSNDGANSSGISSPQSASYTLESDGDIVTTTTTGGAVDAGDWITPKASAPSDYEVYATVTSGALTSGTTGSWIALTSNRTWTVTQTGVGASDATLTIEIRKGAGATLTTATITLNAEVF